MKLFKTQTYPMEVTKMRKLMVVCLLASMPVAGYASPQISIQQLSEKEVVERQGDKNVIKRVPATSVDPGQKLIFTIRYRNRGSSAARNVVLDNRLPDNAIYLAGSASGKGAEVTFSSDGGQTYAAANRLRYQFVDRSGKTVTINAKPEHYTHVRWTVVNIEAGEAGQVSYAVRVK
jgi:uncharacterized repeat protein (TIGR01451 family)